MQFQKHFFVLMKITCVFIVCFLSSCSSTSFQKEGVELREIVVKTNNLLEILDTENNYNESGEVISSTIKFDYKKSIAYIIEKKQRINEIFSTLKEHINKHDSFKNDSIYLFTFMNEFIYSITGDKNEDVCNYLVKIKDGDIPDPSEWLIDEFFGPLFTTPETIDAWKASSNKKKIENIKRYLLAVSPQFQSCITKGDIYDK